MLTCAFCFFQTANVRELLGLGPPYYFSIVPQSKSGASKYVGTHIYE